MESTLPRMGKFVPSLMRPIFLFKFSSSVPTDVHVFRGVPHAFRRWGDKLPGSKKWDQVLSQGITWALSKPSAGPFVIHSD